MSDARSSSNPRLEIDEQAVGWLVFDDPERRLNVFTQPMMEGLSARLDEASEMALGGRLNALVLWSGKPDSFFAGADVDGIESIEDPGTGAEASRAGQAVFQKVADLGIPTVAAIHGVCLGGGLEISLACRHRVASDHDKTRMGLPEVLLGILPAWGGTTRLPRLLGLQKALDLILSGKNLDGRRALRAGLVDAVLPWGTFRAAVEQFTADRVAGKPLKPRKTTLVNRFLDGTGPGRRIVLRQARKQVMKRTGGHYPAPLRVLEVLKATLSRPVAAGLEAEANAAGELIASQVSKSLIHVFNLREAARKGTGVSGQATPGEIRHMGVVGAGVMGGGIAQLAAHRGVDVRLKDINREAITGALQTARGLFDGLVKRRRLSRKAAAQEMERISGGLDWAGFRATDLVVEAVVERMDVKRTVLAELEKEVRRETILTSNTSTLSIDGMAEALTRPDKFAGMHFFNPVHKMPLVEVIRGSRTTDPTVATVYGYALRLGKVPVVVGDGPGFLVNRILGPYLNEAGFLLGEGGSIQQIDDVAREFGMPMGPLRLIDEVGIDVMRHAGEVLHEAFGERMDPAPPLVKLGETGRLGRKAGLGFYTYENGQDTGVDESLYALLVPTVPASRDRLDADEVRRRLVLAMVNEAALALEAGIVSSAGDVDLAMIMGTGFPPFRGGLLRFADQAHPKVILERLEEYAGRFGPRFEPAGLIRDLARDGSSFYAAFPGPASR
jgi:3-hydroxyacyl-CoA dehydrogenase/enoyl-CoA hydratase/3-hydroxybutyryl-CoA epimerase